MMVKLTILFVLTVLAVLTEHAVFSPGREKETVIIGSQRWMVKNLDVSTFRNGDPVPQAKSEAEWEAAGKNGRPAWCYYDRDPAVGKIYGKLYNWYAVSDSRLISPEGWHVPDVSEWQIVVEFNGGDNLAAGKLKERGTQHWQTPNTGAGNASDFYALPGGYRDSKGEFFSMGRYAAFWSSTPAGKWNAQGRHMSHGDTKVYHDNIRKAMGFSIRCIKDQNRKE